MLPQSLIIRTLAAAGLILLACFGLNFIIDPYDVFGVRLFRATGEMQERFRKVEYLKSIPQTAFDTYLLGSSRVGVIRPEDIDRSIRHAKTFNFTVAYANQWDVERLIHWLVERHGGVKRIIVQVDWPEAYGQDQSDAPLLTAMHPDISGVNHYAFLWSYVSLFSTNAISAKIRTNIVPEEGNTYDSIRGNWSRPNIDTRIDADCGSYVRAQPAFNVLQLPRSAKVISQNIQSIARYAQFLQSKNIELILVLTPHNWRVLDRLDYNDYVSFLTALVAIHPLHNLMFYSPITNNDCNYYESSHYRPKIGTLIADLIARKDWSDDPNQSLQMSRASLEQQLIWLKANFDSARRAGNRNVESSIK